MFSTRRWASFLDRTRHFATCQFHLFLYTYSNLYETLNPKFGADANVALRLACSISHTFTTAKLRHKLWWVFFLIDFLIKGLSVREMIYLYFFNLYMYQHVSTWHTFCHVIPLVCTCRSWDCESFFFKIATHYLRLKRTANWTQYIYTF